MIRMMVLQIHRYQIGRELIPCTAPLTPREAS